MARRRKPTVWEALNEPIIQITEAQAKNIIFAAVMIMFAAWIAPYWGRAGATVYYYSPETVFERVAGAQTANYELPTTIAPEWYYVASEMPGAVVEAFAVGANEVLDISGPVTEITDFYQPGTDAVWNEWLNLMRDPGTLEF